MFDPFDPVQNARLMGQARRDSTILTGHPELGEDAMQIVLARVAAGDARPLQSPAMFRSCVQNQIRDLWRQQRRLRSLDHSNDNDSGDLDRPELLLALGLVTEPEIWAELDRQHEGRVRAALRRRLAPAIRALGDLQSAAVRARIRQWLVLDGGEDAVREFERHWGVDLGHDTGTAALARRLRRSPGTLACLATRGLAHVARLLKGVQDE